MNFIPPTFDELTDGDPRRKEFILRWSKLLTDTYRHWTGRELVTLPPQASAEQMARAVFEAPQVIVSGGAEQDQILCYGNRAALELWEMDWDTLTRTPSRLTAEPIHRDERARFLQRVRERGYVDDYRGVRISRTGKRFRIEAAVVWNLVDADGAYLGQAATFSEHTPLP